MGHELNDERSLAYHRAIAARLSTEESIAAAARVVVARWRERQTPAAYYVERWAALLAKPAHELAAALVDGSEEACALRQVSPFTSALSPRERWAIWRQTRQLEPIDDARTA